MIERINVFYKGLGSEDPGGAGAYAWIALHDDELLHQEAKFLEPDAKLSRFVAEYRGLIAAMQWLIDNGKHPHHIRFHGDEALIVNQMIRRWKPKNNLFSICRQAQFVQSGLKDAGFVWIAMDKNPALKPAMDALIQNGIDPRPFLEAQERVEHEKIANGDYQ